MKKRTIALFLFAIIVFITTILIFITNKSITDYSKNKKIDLKKFNNQFVGFEGESVDTKDVEILLRKVIESNRKNSNEVKVYSNIENFITYNSFYLDYDLNLLSNDKTYIVDYDYNEKGILDTITIIDGQYSYEIESADYNALWNNLEAFEGKRKGNEIKELLGLAEVINNKKYNFNDKKRHRISYKYNESEYSVSSIANIIKEEREYNVILLNDTINIFNIDKDIKIKGDKIYSFKFSNNIKDYSDYLFYSFLLFIVCLYCFCKEDNKEKAIVKISVLLIYASIVVVIFKLVINIIVSILSKML